MPDLSTPQLVVDHGARAFESIETDLADAHRKLTTHLVEVIDAGHGLGLTGDVQVIIYRSRAQVIAGKVAAALADLAEFHRELTVLAQDRQLDIPTPRSGGGTRP